MGDQRAALKGAVEQIILWPAKHQGGGEMEPGAVLPALQEVGGDCNRGRLAKGRGGIPPPPGRCHGRTRLIRHHRVGSLRLGLRRRFGWRLRLRFGG